MVKPKITRMNKNKLQSNVEVVKAVQELSSYTPINPDYTLSNLEARLDEVNRLRAVEDAADRALKAARDKTILAEWKLHKIAMGAKDQVAAQYGKDSDEYRSLGLKKKSDYKKHGPRSKTEDSQA